MAYLKSIATDCNSCLFRRATKELFNMQNSSYGIFCSACAKVHLAKLLREEKQVLDTFKEKRSEHARYEMHP
jgi:uncharacterized Zn finger protein